VKTLTEQALRRHSVLLSYSNVDDKLEGYKIKSALPFKIFSTLSSCSPLEKVSPRCEHFGAGTRQRSEVWLKNWHDTSDGTLDRIEEGVLKKIAMAASSFFASA
jgi:hypothetical protein